MPTGDRVSENKEISNFKHKNRILDFTKINAQASASKEDEIHVSNLKNRDDTDPLYNPLLTVEGASDESINAIIQKNKKKLSGTDEEATLNPYHAVALGAATWAITGAMIAGPIGAVGGGLAGAIELPTVGHVIKKTKKLIKEIKESL